MFSKKTKASLGVETARGLIEDPEIRQAAAQVAAGSSQLGLSVTKRIARRKTRRRIKRYQDVAQAVRPMLASYGPQAAQSLGLIDEGAAKRLDKQLAAMQLDGHANGKRPKARTRPALAAGMLLGASSVYFLEPGASGREHREQLSRAVTAIRS